MTKGIDRRLVAFVACLLLGAAAHAQTDSAGRLDPSDAGTQLDSAETDPADDIGSYRLAADQGDAYAQFQLGLRYGLGEGVEKDDAEAARWYRLAAEQGNADAQYILGLKYGLGIGVDEDKVEAARWYRLAAEQGNADVQLTLGMHYTLGQGVEQDMAEGARWYRLAAEQDNAEAQLRLGMMYSVGDGVEHDLGRAANWIRLAAENGHDKAADMLDSREAWRCYSATDARKTNVLLSLSRLGPGGEVSVAGTTYSTSFEVQGLNRRWDFGPNDHGYDYMFLIEPDGTGLYVDFSRSTDGSSKPSQMFVCEQSP